MKQVKIAISGKAGSGKDTAASFILNHEMMKDFNLTKKAFADPLKEIAGIMYPDIPKEWIYGPSQLRASVIDDSFKENEKLTVRQLLIDIGTNGRNYNENIWIESALADVRKSKEKSFIFSDVRFRNEFDSLKKNGFFMIRVKREKISKIDSPSENEMDFILDDEFDYVINNDLSIDSFYQKIDKCLKSLVIKK
jgi:hypothetical protein